MTTADFEALFQSAIPGFKVENYEAVQRLDYSKGTLLSSLEIDPATVVIQNMRAISLKGWPKRVTLMDTDGLADGVLNTGRLRYGNLASEYNFSVVGDDVIMEMISVTGVEKTKNELIDEGYSAEDAYTAARNKRRHEYIFKGREVASFLDSLSVDFKVSLSNDGKVVQFVNNSTVGGVPYKDFNPDLKSYVGVEVEGASRYGLPLYISPINVATEVEEIEGEGISMDYTVESNRYFPQVAVDTNVTLKCVFEFGDNVKSEYHREEFEMKVSSSGFEIVS